ncbi:hypothetical protein CCHL11_02085 [Colletotrichum chlorophyti]|uniref:Uncharacterized protein n=1 Tax=Colletotrichum chlorophyti TaxID=708187 RepID=A0A1Q8S6W2_9PEZI|nr:hypothetical protein CCHL11_02085 [Colletotrichum chlorophyti]
MPIGKSARNDEHVTGRELDGSQLRLGGAPPPYEETAPSATPELTPEDDAPPYADAIPSVSSPATSVPATVKFPPVLNAYVQRRFTKTFHLGTSADAKLFAVYYRTGILSKQRDVTVYDGPSDKAPVLATAGRTSGVVGTDPATITVPPRKDHGEAYPFRPR